MTAKWNYIAYRISTERAYRISIA